VSASANGHGKLPARQLLLHEVMAFLSRYVICTPEQLLIVALWVLHTHAMDAVEDTPYLAINSPEKRCGKSTLLKALDLLCARAWETILPSEAVVYRKIDADHPTLLLDETDRIFNPHTAHNYEGLAALLNAGNRRGTKVPRCSGANKTKLVDFDVFCAKALAGIATLPDTIADRSVPIRLERKTRADTVERFRRRDVEPIGAALHKQLANWGKHNTERLRNARPTMPDELDDRAQDGCEILVAIADLVGVGTKARKALVALYGGERLDSDESLRLRLLRDTRMAFGTRSKTTTRMLLTKLYALDEAPWRTYYKRGLRDTDLAHLLRPYGIHSTTVRIKRKGKADLIRKGYTRDSFHKAWERYL
jgi:hypothetical protein